MVIEESALGDSNSNGVAEAAVKVHQRLARTLKLGLEAWIGCEILDRSNVFAWMVRWSAMCHRRYHVGEDGWTSFQRMRGKNASRTMVEFGEVVFFMPP